MNSAPTLRDRLLLAASRSLPRKLTEQLPVGPFGKGSFFWIQKLN